MTTQSKQPDGLGWISAAITGGISLTTAIISALKARKQAKQAAKVAAAEAEAAAAQQQSYSNYVAALNYLNSQRQQLAEVTAGKQRADWLKYGAIAATVLLLLYGSKK